MDLTVTLSDSPVESSFAGDLQHTRPDNTCVARMCITQVLFRTGEISPDPDSVGTKPDVIVTSLRCTGASPYYTEHSIPTQMASSLQILVNYAK